MESIRKACAEVARHDEARRGPGAGRQRAVASIVAACPRTARALLELAEAVDLIAGPDAIRPRLTYGNRKVAVDALARAAAILRGEDVDGQ